MSAVITGTDDQLFTALGACFAAILPGIPVMQTQVNRVAQPTGPDYVMLTELSRDRLSLNVPTYTDGGAGNPGFVNNTAPTQVTVQCDVYGPNSSNNAQIVSTLWRDEFTCDAMAAAGINGQPITCTDPRQATITNAEAQFETRYTLDLVLQYNITVSTPMQFADSIKPILTDVVTAYPVGAS